MVCTPRLVSVRLQHRPHEEPGAFRAAEAAAGRDGEPLPTSCQGQEQQAAEDKLQRQ